MLMFIWFWARWWYGAGWGWAWQRAVAERVSWCNDAFSLSRLIQTWAAPFKQTASGRVRGSMGDHLRAWLDRVVSRTIGFLVRSVLIFAGVVACVLVFIFGLIFMVAWPILPILPIICVVLWISGAAG
jgi:hypothetical protein